MFDKLLSWMGVDLTPKPANPVQVIGDYEKMIDKMRDQLVVGRAVPLPPMSGLPPQEVIERKYFLLPPDKDSWDAMSQQTRELAKTAPEGTAVRHRKTLFCEVGLTVEHEGTEDFCRLNVIADVQGGSAYLSLDRGQAGRLCVAMLSLFPFVKSPAEAEVSFQGLQVWCPRCKGEVTLMGKAPSCPRCECAFTRAPEDAFFVLPERHSSESAVPPPKLHMDK